MNLRPLIRTIVCIALAACSAPPQDAQPLVAEHDSRPTPAAAPAPATGRAEPPATEAAAPSPASVIEAVFQHPGDRSASYDVENGSRATYWFGYAYDVAGKRYYTGFVEQTPDHLGANADADDPPAAKATLTQATFVRNSSHADWDFVGAQRFVGEVGGRGRADAPDETRRAVLHDVSPGRFLLAVPTNAAIEQGTVQKNYEVLLRANDGAWAHVATVNAGVDDSAGCDGGRVFPCAGTTGHIEFVTTRDMPSIRVTLSPQGNTSSREHTVTYTFDSASSTYQAP